MAVPRTSGLLWQIKAGAILYGAALRSASQYRADLLISLLVGVVYQTTGFFTLWVLLARFDVIAGWTVEEVALLYGMRLVAHSVWVVPGNQLGDIEPTLREGRFDRYLIRPVNPLVQLLSTRLWLAPMGDLLAGSVLLGLAVSIVDVEWTAGRIAFLVVAILGGALVEGGIQLGLSSLAFRTLSGREARHQMDFFFNLYAHYPARIYGVAGQWLLTAVIPVVFVAYLPASVLLGHTEELLVPAAVAYASPLMGPLIAVAGYLLWRSQLRSYQSSGH